MESLIAFVTTVADSIPESLVDIRSFVNQPHFLR
jgi:hypothetical protein